MSKNKNLHIAKKEKNDEFYTMYEDIQKEVKEYKEQLKDKIIYCNCDNPEYSNFWKYLSDNFEYYELKKLISSHYNPNGNSYKLEISRNINNKIITTKTQLIGNGDFRSDECVEILKGCDIVITNPPFSLFREYIAQLMEYDKKFLILGNNNAITYKDVFTYIKENRMWLGYTSNKTMFFQLSDDYEKWEYIKDDKKYGRCPAISWFTNLYRKPHKDLILSKKYKPEEYPKYDNYDAINVDKVKDIPIDYFGYIGVPITYLTKHNPGQFEIVGSNRGVDQDVNGIYGKSTYLNGKETFKRLFIKRKCNSIEFEILGMASSAGYNKEIVEIPFLGIKDARPIIKGKNTYARVFIKRKCNSIEFEIIGNEYDLNIEKGRGYINGKRMYSRIFIKRK